MLTTSCFTSLPRCKASPARTLTLWSSWILNNWSDNGDWREASIAVSGVAVANVRARRGPEARLQVGMDATTPLLSDGTVINNPKRMVVRSETESTCLDKIKELRAMVKVVMHPQ